MSASQKCNKIHVALVALVSKRPQKSKIFNKVSDEWDHNGRRQQS